MPAGKLRHRVTFQRPDGEGEREGERVTDQCLSWQDVATRSAQVRPVSVKEIYAAGGFLGQTDLVVTVRYWMTWTTPGAFISRTVTFTWSA